MAANLAATSQIRSKRPWLIANVVHDHINEERVSLDACGVGAHLGRILYEKARLEQKRLNGSEQVNLVWTRD